MNVPRCFHAAGPPRRPHDDFRRGQPRVARDLRASANPSIVGHQRVGQARDRTGCRPSTASAIAAMAAVALSSTAGCIRHDISSSCRIATVRRVVVDDEQAEVVRFAADRRRQDLGRRPTPKCATKRNSLPRPLLPSPDRPPTLQCCAEIVSPVRCRRTDASSSCRPARTLRKIGHRFSVGRTMPVSEAP